MGTGTGKAFPTTDWALLSRARVAEQARAKAPTDELLRRYLPAILRYLTRVKQLSRDEAEELIQGFVTEKIIEGALLQSADRRRGRFRNLLLRALEHYLVDVRRRAGAAARRLGTSAVDPEGFLNAVGEPVLTAFEAEWARSVLAEAVTRTYGYCQERQRDDLWQVLRSRVVDPIVGGTLRPAYKELVSTLGYGTARQAANALLMAKRIFIRMLRDVLLEHAGEDADAAEELADLREILARRPKSCVVVRK